MRSLPIRMPAYCGRMYYASPLAVIAQHPTFEDWLPAQFIQVHCGGVEATRRLGYADFKFTSADDPFHYRPILNVETAAPLSAEEEDILDLIFSLLDSGQYVYTYVDKFYVPDNPFSFKTHYFQETFVYGYDHVEGTAAILGFNRNRSYRMSTIPLTDLAAGIRKSMTANPRHQLYGMGLNESYREPFVMADTIRHIGAYVHAGQLGSKVEDQSEQRVYGMDTYPIVQLSLQLLIDGTDRVITNIATLHMMWEHKRLMLERIRYMERRHFVTIDDRIEDGYLIIIAKLEKARNQLLRFEIKRDKRLIEPLLASLSEIAEKERDLLELFLLRVGNRGSSFS